jgi:hypothetical protein
LDSGPDLNIIHQITKQKERIHPIWTCLVG